MTEIERSTTSMARDYIAALPPELFPNMVSLADEFALTDADERRYYGPLRGRGTNSLVVLSPASAALTT